jgi:hypothetical protein
LLLITGATSISVDKLVSFQNKGIDYDTFFETSMHATGNRIDTDIEVSTLRNLENGVVFKFEHAIVSCDMAPNSIIRVTDRAGKKITFDIESVCLNREPEKNISSVSAAFYYFWSDFLEAVVTKKINKTSAINSLLTTTWIEAIYNKINCIA